MAPSRKQVMDSIHETARDVPVVETCDVCVVGGGCTGALAAVAAARRGARTVIIEANGFFGGAATAGLVSLWHHLLDERLEKQVIGGLTVEVLRRLQARQAVSLVRSGPNTHLHLPSHDGAIPTLGERIHFVLNTDELKIELDTMLVEARVRPFLHAMFVGMAVEDRRPTAAIIEDKSGRRAIRAAYFIDATGDADVVVHAGLPWTKRETLMPPTMCARIRGLRTLMKRHPDFDIKSHVFDPAYPNALPKGFLWSAGVVGVEDELMVAGTRVAGTDGSDADSLTHAEIEGRRQVRAMLDIIREHVPGGEIVSLAALPAAIGLRESRKAVCLHRLTGDELLHGARFPDAVANGTYPVDIHYSDRPGITFRRLDGTETYCPEKGPKVQTRWREETPESPTYYQIPYRCLVVQGAPNVLAAGRCIDTDASAFGATRVMVNCNQTGEAAGAAAVLALQTRGTVADVNTEALRADLTRGGATLFGE